MPPSKKTKPERRTVSVISVPDARPDDGLFNPFKEAKAAEGQTTAVPQYSSTAVPEQKVEENAPPIQPAAPLITAVPEYRSTVVPESGYYKKANAVADQIDRTLEPAESKVFEQLLRLTVGFNTDRRQVRVSVLMDRTGYKSDKTVRQALSGLEAKGRIRRLTHNNSPAGDEYQILAYSGNTPVPQYRSTPVESTAVLESKVTGELKTDLKEQDRSDDEPAARTRSLIEATRSSVEASGHLVEALAPLLEASTAAVGRELTASEVARFKEVSEVLAAELRIAAARTTVSNVPAFLAEHLRRRLWKKDKAQLAAEAGPENVSGGQQAQAVADAKNCPDCGGTGLYYPDGFEKGVAKCAHPHLREGKGGPARD